MVFGSLPLFVRSRGLAMQSNNFTMLLLPGLYEGAGNWTSSISAGTSASNSFVNSGGTPPPLTGNYADFDGSTHFMNSTNMVNNLISLNAGTVICISRFNAGGFGGGFGNSTYVGNVNPGGGSPFADFGLTHTSNIGAGTPSTNGITSYIRMASNTQNGIVKTTFTTFPSAWYMQTLTWSSNGTNSTTLTSYNNGSQIGQSNYAEAPNSVVPNSVPLRLGKGSTNGGTNYFNMDIRFVATSNTTFSAIQLQSIYFEASDLGWLT